MKRFFLLTTIISGAVAAYLMYRRGERLSTIAQEVIVHPIGSLVREAKADI